LVLAVSAAVGGWRLGFVARAFSWIGMGLGVYAATRIIPVIGSSEEDPQRLLLLGMVILFAGAIVGQVVGLLVGARLRTVITPGPVQTADRVGGAFAGTFGVFVAFWFLLPTLSQTPQWPAEQARDSRIAAFIHDHFPEAPDTTQALRRVLGPRVFEGFGPAPALGPPPAETGLSEALANRVAQSTVKVEAPACSRIQDGSGSVVADGLIVTNAHVVAGSKHPTVLRHPDGVALDATVVAFDPDRDVAVLRVPGISRPPLAMGDGSFGIGGVGAVFGHPYGGPLKLSPFKIGDITEAHGFDIYDQGRTTRRIDVLSSDLAPGDSGGALVDASGTVQGVAFAIAPDQPNVGYALTLDEIRPVLATAGTAAVNTGPCIQ
ncbi:MAG TPA: MarP family serine protease, partial [Acidimicrobiales bacterium]|nr:MarP family serine protease [Acidimicrobiales bacterium]